MPSYGSFDASSFGKKLAVGAAVVTGVAAMSIPAWWGPTFGAGGGGGGGSTPDAQGTANVWVDQAGANNGGNCAHSASLIAEPTRSTVCATLTGALTVAHAGDVVMFANNPSGGVAYFPTSYPAPEFCAAFTTGFASTVTIKNSPDAQAWVACHQNLGSNGTTENIAITSDKSSGGFLKMNGLSMAGSGFTITDLDVTCNDDSLHFPVDSAIISPGDPPIAPQPSPGPTSASNTYCSAWLSGEPQNLTWTGGSVGPTFLDGCAVMRNITDGGSDDGAPLSADSQFLGRPALGIASNLSFTGVLWHDARYPDPANRNSGCAGVQVHTENLTLDGTNTVTIKDSKFYGGGTSGYIILTNNNADQVTYAPHDMLIANDWFVQNVPGQDLIGNTNPINTDRCTTNCVFSFNTVAPCCSSIGAFGGNANWTIQGNIGHANGCPSTSTGTITYLDNFWFSNTGPNGTDTNCGGNSIIYDVAHDPTPDIFINAAGSTDTFSSGSIQLKTGTSPSPINIAGLIGHCPAGVDFAGQSRYYGTGPDAGAVEYNDGGSVTAC